jgi:hypothetical protein
MRLLDANYAEAIDTGLLRKAPQIMRSIAHRGQPSSQQQANTNARTHI